MGDFFLENKSEISLKFRLPDVDKNLIVLRPRCYLRAVHKRLDGVSEILNFCSTEEDFV